MRVNADAGGGGLEAGLVVRVGVGLGSACTCW